MRVMDEKKLQEITEFIKQYARENNGDAPGLADIMDYMSMAKTTAYRYMLELKKRGIVSYNGKKTLETPLQRKMRCEFRRVPILGMVICGTPDEQEEFDRKRKNRVPVTGKERFAMMMAAFSVYGPILLCCVGAFTAAALIMYLFLR